MAFYQYTGPDADAPQKTTLMGKYKFSKNGRYVDVTDERVLSKIGGIPGFRLKKAKKTPVTRKRKSKVED